MSNYLQARAQRRTGAPKSRKGSRAPRLVRKASRWLPGLSPTDLATKPDHALKRAIKAALPLYKAGQDPTNGEMPNVSAIYDGYRALHQGRATNTSIINGVFDSVYADFGGQPKAVPKRDIGQEATELALGELKDVIFPARKLQSGKELQGNWSEALRFLGWLGNHKYRFVCKFEGISREKRIRAKGREITILDPKPVRARTFTMASASLETAIAVAACYNASENRTILVNLHDGGHAKAQSVTEMRVLFVDLDSVDVKGMTPAASLLVESSPKHYHAYFRLKAPVAVSRGLVLQRALSEHLGGDPNCLSAGAGQQVKLPGTIHAKFGQRGAHILKIVSEGPDYDSSELERLTGADWGDKPATQSLLLEGELLPTNYFFGQCKCIDKALSLKKGSYRAQAFELACRSLAAYKAHMEDPANWKGHLVNIGKARLPELTATSISRCVNRAFRRNYPLAPVPPEIASARARILTLENWVKCLTAEGTAFSYEGAVLTRPSEVRDTAARLFLGKYLRRAGWKVRKQRPTGGRWAYPPARP